jgi:hypothetical protein
VKHNLPTPDPIEVVRLWLDPQNEAEEAVLVYMATTMRRQLPTLAEMLTREMKRAMRQAGATAREECRQAIQDLINEIDLR